MPYQIPEDPGINALSNGSRKNLCANATSTAGAVAAAAAAAAAATATPTVATKELIKKDLRAAEKGFIMTCRHSKGVSESNLQATLENDPSNRQKFPSSPKFRKVLIYGYTAAYRKKVTL